MSKKIWKKTTLSHHHQRIPRWPNPSSPSPLLHLHNYYQFFSIRSTICFIIMLLFSIYCPQKLLMKLSKKNKKISVYLALLGVLIQTHLNLVFMKLKKKIWKRCRLYDTPLEAMADLKNLFYVTCVYTGHVFAANGSHLQRDGNCLLPLEAFKWSFYFD